MLDIISLVRNHPFQVWSLELIILNFPLKTFGNHYQNMTTFMPTFITFTYNHLSTPFLLPDRIQNLEQFIKNLFYLVW